MKITWCMVPEIWSATYKLFCHFGSFFSKSKFWKNTWIYYHFTNYDNMIYGSWDMECDRQNFLFISGFFALLLPNDLKNQSFEKMKKKAWRYLHLRQVYQKLWSHDVRFLRYGARWTDGQKDRRTEERWKKWHIEMGDPSKKIINCYLRIL